MISCSRGRRPSLPLMFGGRSLGGLWLRGLLLGGVMVLSGCAGSSASPPNPFEGGAFFPEVSGPASSGRGALSRGGALRGDTFCQGTALSGEKGVMHFSLVGVGRGGESDAPDQVMALARRDALGRALRCSGTRQIVRSFFDNMYHIGDREGQVLEQDLIETMAAFSRYEATSQSCHVTGVRLTCRVRLLGEMRIEKADPGFAITNLSLPRGGVLPAGSSLTVKLKVRVPATRRVWLYLFDVDSRGQGSLLYPSTKDPTETSSANALLTLPRPGSGEIFRVALPPKAKRTVEHLFVVVLRKGPLTLAPHGQAQGKNAVLQAVPDFSREVLRQLFRLRGAGSLWTFREIPFEIVSASEGQGGSSPAP